MARGKHRAKKARQDAQARQELIEQLTAELAQERAARTVAEQAAEEAVSLRTTLARLTRLRDDAVGGEMAGLETEADELERVTLDAENSQRRVDDVWQRVLSRLIGGRGIEGIEDTLRALGGGPDAVVVDQQHKSVSREGAWRIEMARGERPPDPQSRQDKNERSSLPAFVRPVIRGAWERCAGAQADVLNHLTEAEAEQLARRAEAVWDSTAQQPGPDSVAAWFPFPAYAEQRDGAGYALPPALGAAPESGWQPGRVSHDRLRADDLQPSIQRDAMVARAAPRIPHPWSAPPRFRRAGDAVLLRHWYATAAYGAWLRAAETPIPDRIQPADESTWQVHPAAPQTMIAADVAVGLRDAVPYWLPPGQVASFAESEPLTQVDLGDVRMPFSTVLLVPAEPLLLPPADPPTDEAAAKLRDLDRVLLALRHSKETKLTQFYRRLDESGVDHDRRPTLADALTHRVSHLEAILYFADSQGALSDKVALCLAIDTEVEGTVAGRVTVPALRSRCGWKNAIDNLAAVVAWGNWHQPDEELQLPVPTPQNTHSLAKSKSFGDLEHRGGAGHVRVLDVARTNRDDTARGTPTGRTVAPHVRRGHWRRQHYGTGGLQVKRIRIPPTLINAGRMSDIGPRVYKLPDPEPSQATQSAPPADHPAP